MNWHGFELIDMKVACGDAGEQLFFFSKAKMEETRSKTAMDSEFSFVG
jgi:hypothetical protein